MGVTRQGYGGRGGVNSSFEHCQRLKHRFQHLALRKEVRIFFHSSRRRPWLVLTINRSGNQGSILGMCYPRSPFHACDDGIGLDVTDWT